jgi:uncharacterized protein YeaO (DUF488 family)
MTIKIKSIYDPIEGNEGKRIMITRFHPKKPDRKTPISLEKHGISLWYRDISPSYDLLQDWKDGLVGNKKDTLKKRWDALKDRYFKELDDASCAMGHKEKVKQCIESIKECEFFDGNVTLVTFPNEMFYGYMLKEYVLSLSLDKTTTTPIIS